LYTCRALAHFPPSLLSGLSIKGCNLCLLVDRADNDQTSRRQGKLDTLKSNAEVAAEEALSAAVLFSLAGANAVVMNQWETTFYSNGRLVRRLFENLVKGKQQLGEAVHNALQQPVDLSAPVNAPVRRNSKGVAVPAVTPATTAPALAKPQQNASLLGLKSRVMLGTVLYGIPSFTTIA